MEQLENSFSLCSFPRQIPKHFCLFGGFTYFLSHQWLSATPTRVALWGKHFSFTKKIYIFPCGGWHLSCDSSSGCLYPYLPLTHHSQPVPGYSLAGATAPSWLTPCCFQGSCLTLHGASFHLPLHSSPVLTEGNQSEIQLSRLISIVKGCGEYAIIQPGCMAAPCVTGEENQSEKRMHQRDSSQGPLISLYRACLEKIRGHSCLNSGTKVRPQLTPAPTPNKTHRSRVS